MSQNCKQGLLNKLLGLRKSVSTYNIISGKSLYLVIFITFVLSLIISFFILRNYYFNREVIDYNMLKKLVDAVNVELHTQIASNKSASFEQEGLETVFTTSRWGAYHISVCKTNWKDLNYQKVALHGTQIPAKNRQGLYLADHGKYLSIAGETRLAGLTTLPKLGVRSVYIDGTPYRGDELVYGQEAVSNEKLPDLNDEFSKWLEGIMATHTVGSDTLIAIRDIYSSIGLKNSFTNKTMVVDSPEELNLKRVNLDGNIAVCSNIAISVSRSAKLNNVLLVAPQIYIDKGFFGSIQAFASDTLFIAEGATLSYPSFVGVYSLHHPSPYLYISEGALVEGGVLCKSKEGDNAGASNVIEENAMIYGHAYCGGSISISGEIYGSLFTDKFVLKTKRGYYENHILDVVVDPTELIDNYVLPDIFTSEAKKNIILYLN